MKKVLFVTALGLALVSNVFAADIKKVDDNTVAIAQPDIQITLDQILDQEKNLQSRLKVFQAQETLTASQLTETQALKDQMVKVGILSKKAPVKSTPVKIGG